MRIFELVIIGIILSGCVGFIYWALADLFRQLKANAERCESLDEASDENKPVINELDNFELERTRIINLLDNYYEHAQKIRPKIFEDFNELDYGEKLLPLYENEYYKLSRMLDVVDGIKIDKECYEKAYKVSDIAIECYEKDISYRAKVYFDILELKLIIDLKY